MNTSARHNNQKHQGAAMILVVVLTVLLAVVGVMFMMTSRINDMSSAAVIDNRDLDAGVQTVVGRINTILTQDLFGTDLKKAIMDNADTNVNEPYDIPGDADRWLANIEPEIPNFNWSHLSDISKSGVASLWNSRAQIVPEYPKYNDPNMNGLIADADGDGVADAMWIRLDDMCTSKGKPIFAAVRIIDNCAMLNLNTAYGFYQNITTDNRPWYIKPWYETSAHLFAGIPYDKAVNSGQDFGRLLSEINYGPFLRGLDVGKIERIRLARDPIVNPTKPIQAALTSRDYHDKVVMDIESPEKEFALFDIGDELEIRNRYLLTSYGISRFEREDIAYETFDWGRGEFVGGWNVPLRSKRVPVENNDDLLIWKERLSPFNFDAISGGPNPYYYDRRHVCTFYSFDRNLRSGDYSFLTGQPEAVKRYFRPEKYQPIDLLKIRFNNTIDSRRQVVHLLYGFREFYLLEGLALADAAQKSAQIIANIIDYADDNTDAGGVFGNADYGSQKNLDITYIDKAIVDKLLLEVSGDAAIAGNPAFQFGLSATETIYGLERQPFISEVYCRYDGTAGGAMVFAVELLNPYDTAIPLENWRLIVGGTTYPLDNTVIVPAATSQTQPGFLTIYAAAGGYANPPIAAGTQKNINGFGLGTGILTNKVSRLQRPEPTDPVSSFITVDEYTSSQITDLILDGVHVLKRDTSGWKFANNLAVAPVDSTSTLGQDNNVSVSRKGYPLPVANANSGFGMLNDFTRVAFVSNAKASAADPNCITAKIAAAPDESAVRLDVAKDAGLLNGLCFMSRTQGTLPGRININTAPVHVIAAAMTPPLLMWDSNDPNHPLAVAGQIVANRPYKKVADLLNLPAMKKYASTGSPDVGDPAIDNDLEERDWILSRLSNIFTVRSDTFTAYVLVRLGVDGPQRRMIAIFDRSNVWSPQDKPKLVALHPAPDPR